jgi:CheY-like chemotaxis protein
MRRVMNSILLMLITVAILTFVSDALLTQLSYAQENALSFQFLYNNTAQTTNASNSESQRDDDVLSTISTRLHKCTDSATDPDIQTREDGKQISSEGGELHERKIKRILVVDDEPDTCMVYQMVLEDVGYECVSYTDSVKAVEEFKPYFYDLIILDIRMPVLNGFELCKKIIDFDKSVRVLFITASEQQFYENIREKSYPELNNISSIKYIQKPVGNEELVKLVNMTITTK